ncbi:MAG: rhodanese-like domain-containing protein [Thermomicrobiales bacterium]
MEPPIAPEITVEEFIRYRFEAKPQIVDVREPDEYLAGRISGSGLMPLAEIGSRMSELDPRRPVVTVCRSGKRSLYAAAAMLAAGFRDVRSLAGGMIAWSEAGQPVEF